MADVLQKNDEGKRASTRIKVECQSVLIGCSNLVLSSIMSAPLLRRFNVMNFNQRVEMNRTVHEMSALIDLMKQSASSESPRKAKAALRYRYWQTLMHILEAWIESEIVDQPSTDIAAAFKSTFVNELRLLGYPMPG